MARGFGATRGSGTTDKVVTGFQANNHSTLSWAIWSWRNGAGGGNFGRFWQSPGSTSGADAAWHDSAAATYTYEHGFSTTDGVWTIPAPSASAWHLYSGSYDYSSTTNDPVMYLDGVSQTVTESFTPVGTAFSTAAAYTIGNRDVDNARVWNGDHAYFTRWNVILTANEHAAMARGVPPWKIRPDAIVACVPLWGLHSPELDFIDANGTATVTGTAFRTDPPVDFFMDFDPAVLPADGAQIVTLGLVTETETAFPFTSPNQTVTLGLVTETETVFPIAAKKTIVISDNFEGSSVNVAASSVDYTDLSNPIISLKPRVQTSEAAVGARHLAIVAKLDGVTGIRPTVRVLDITTGVYHGYPWQAGRRLYWTYTDPATIQSFDDWTPYDTDPTVNASSIDQRHSTAWTQSPVWVSYEPLWTPTQHAAWIAGIVAGGSTNIFNVPSNVSGFVSGTFSNQTDDLGRTVVGPDFHAFKLHTATAPTNDNPKRTLVVTMGTHGREQVGSWVGKRFIDKLLGATALALRVMKEYDTFVYGLVSAPGIKGGHWRSTFQSVSGRDDANRHFSDASPGIENVTIPRNAMLLDLPPRVQFSLDFHGNYADDYSVFYDARPIDAVFDAALEASMGVGVVADAGDSHAGFVAEWFEGTKATTPSFTVETGTPTPLVGADIDAWATAILSAVDSMTTAGNIETVGPMGLVTETESVFPFTIVGGQAPRVPGGAGVALGLGLGLGLPYYPLEN